MININNINPIGIGTFRIDLTKHENTLAALRHSVEYGQNFIDTSYLYEDGKNIEFLADFFKSINREKIFVMGNIEKFVEHPSDVEKQLDTYLKIMKLDYVDCLEIHERAVSKIPLLEMYSAMDALIKKGKVRFLGASNLDLEDLQMVHRKFPLATFQGVFNLENKIYETIGALDFCEKNNIQFIAYQPLRRNRTAGHNYPVLLSLAEKYKKTQNQIILNWIIKEKQINVLLKTTTISRIDENLSSLNFIMDTADYQKLNDFESTEFSNIEIDWKGTGGKGILIHQLPNQFD
ncbi:MAG: aldo/keto reductase [Rickettsiales bacterium]|jgi:diketogulonate reductase-like aldo/keto reductase|nr:aldo/keto reductase [Rickettsiales bacterium]